MLALVMSDLRVPLVIAVNRCDDREQARRIAEYLGASADVPAIPCQLIDPSRREVVAEVLVALLESTDLALATHGVLRDDDARTRQPLLGDECAATVGAALRRTPTAVLGSHRSRVRPACDGELKLDTRRRRHAST